MKVIILLLVGCIAVSSVHGASVGAALNKANNVQKQQSQFPFDDITANFPQISDDKPFDITQYSNLPVYNPATDKFSQYLSFKLKPKSDGTPQFVIFPQYIFKNETFSQVINYRPYISTTEPLSQLNFPTFPPFNQPQFPNNFPFNQPIQTIYPHFATGEVKTRSTSFPTPTKSSQFPNNWPFNQPEINIPSIPNDFPFNQPNINIPQFPNNFPFNQPNINNPQMPNNWPFNQPIQTIYPHFATGEVKTRSSSFPTPTKSSQIPNINIPQFPNNWPFNLPDINNPQFPNLPPFNLPNQSLYPHFATGEVKTRPRTTTPKK